MKHESAAPARRLALQLGEDLDRILESPELETTAPDIVVSAPVSGTLELRQISGLTAGLAMPLGLGTYHFGPTGQGRGLAEGDVHEVGFALHIDEHSEGEGEAENARSDALTITVQAFDHDENHPTTPLRIEGAMPDGPMTVAVGDVIDAGSARFQLAPRRAITKRRRMDQRVERALSMVEGPIETPSLEDIAAAQALTPRRTRRGPVARLTRRNVATSEAVNALFVNALRSHRASVMANRRAAHPDPEALLHQARHAADLAWDCDRTHRAFGQIAIAHGDEPWQPRFEHPERVPDGASSALATWYQLPSVPQVADLRRGPLGIVGPRSSTLAVARQILVSMTVRSAPEDVAVMVMAEEEREEDWAWAAHLPHAHRLFPDALPVVFVDDADQLDGDLADPLFERGGVGTVLLSESADELPPICPTVMTIHEGGTATVVHHDTHVTVLGATPIGISQELAASAVSSLLQRTRQ